MAEALERRILYLLSELLAHALRIIGALNPARAIATRTLQPILDGTNNLFVWIKRYLHVMDAPLPLVHRAAKRLIGPSVSIPDGKRNPQKDEVTSRMANRSQILYNLPTMFTQSLLSAAVLLATLQSTPIAEQLEQSNRQTASDFDTISAWVTGHRFARGANRDRVASGAPQLIAVFTNRDGARRHYRLGAIDSKGRYLLSRKFTEKEQQALTGWTFAGVEIEGALPEDGNIGIEDVRIFREKLGQIKTAHRPKRPFADMKDLVQGFNTGDGTLSFPTNPHTILPKAAADNAPLAIKPQFTGGAVNPDEAKFLSVKHQLRGRTLVVELHAPAGKVTELTLGVPNEAKCVKSIKIPYLPYGDCRLLEGGLFRYAAPDWYRSNASVIETHKPDGTVRIKYLPKTDGSYNPVCERIVIALSDRLEDVFPEIPNPPSPYKAVTGMRTWRTHAASDRSRDAALWRYVHSLGITEVCVMDHETMWRDEAEPFTFTANAAKGRGGDDAQRTFTRLMIDELGYIYGPYNNYTDFADNNTALWSEGILSRNQDGSLVPAWIRCHHPKPTVAAEFCEKIAPIAQRKFGFCGAYCDVHTARTPWSYMDYDARVPGAGTFAQTFYAYGELFSIQRKVWNGPVWSEGGCHFLYAGLTDGNYARDPRIDFLSEPWLVDFDLLKIHPLECDFGMGSLYHFSPGRTLRERQYYQPYMPEGRDRLVDAFICAELAFGHAGYLILDWMWEPAKMFGPAYCGGGRETFEAGKPIAMRSYFMVQPIAARYTQTTAKSIRYLAADGRWLDVSSAIQDDTLNRRQIHVRYADGTHVLANGHASERLRTILGGEEIDLPPYGFRAWTEDRDVFVESGDANGTTTRFDYAETKDFTYIDGRGKPITFRRCRTDGEPKVMRSR